DPETWSTYMGDDDGELDLPLSGVTIQLMPTEQTAGSLWVDGVEVDFETSGTWVIDDFERGSVGSTLWMVGEPDTTVISAEGLGPDRTEPVPMVLARRTAAQTRFDALWVPFDGDAPVQDFAALECEDGSAWSIEAVDWTDRVWLADAAGERTCDGWSSDARFAQYRADPDGDPVRLLVAEGSVLEGEALVVSATAGLEQLEGVWSDGVLAIEVVVDGEVEVTLLGPDVDQVTVEGVPVWFERDGDHVIVPLPPIEVTDTGSGVDSADPGPGGASDGSGSGKGGCGCRSGSTAASLGAWLLVVLACGLRRGRLQGLVVDPAEAAAAGGDVPPGQGARGLQGVDDLTAGEERGRSDGHGSAGVGPEVVFDEGAVLVERNQQPRAAGPGDRLAFVE
ncbi:MAG: hypothetical protein QGG40_08070, partial [Myxococcota bacterium]|nr:hypothetical protein [Myxococcota bacterium]